MLSNESNAQLEKKEQIACALQGSTRFNPNRDYQYLKSRTKRSSDGLLEGTN